MYTLGWRKGWRFRCELPSPLEDGATAHTLAFVFTGETVWLVTMWAQQWDWTKLEAYVDALFAGGSLNELSAPVASPPMGTRHNASARLCRDYQEPHVLAPASACRSVGVAKASLPVEGSTPAGTVSVHHYRAMAGSLRASHGGRFAALPFHVWCFDERAPVSLHTPSGQHLGPEWA